AKLVVRELTLLETDPQRVVGVDAGGGLLPDLFDDAMAVDGPRRIGRHGSLLRSGNCTVRRRRGAEGGKDLGGVDLQLLQVVVERAEDHVFETRLREVSDTGDDIAGSAGGMD